MRRLAKLKVGCLPELYQDGGHRLKSLDAPPVASQDVVIKLFANNAPLAKNHITPKSSREDNQFDMSTAEGQWR